MASGVWGSLGDVSMFGRGVELRTPYVDLAFINVHFVSARTREYTYVYMYARAVFVRTHISENFSVAPRKGRGWGSGRGRERGGKGGAS